MHHADKLERRRNSDGTEFLVVWADDLRAAGYQFKQGGDSNDVTIRLRDGRAWNPADYEGAAEADGEDEDEDEDDGSCLYCGVGHASSGELCHACGTFQV